MSDDYKLTYFDGRGRAEIIRLVFTKAKVPFKDIRLSYEDFAKIKSSLPFHQVPILEANGIKLCQSVTIARYLARKFKLAGSTDVEQAQADMIVDCIEDSLAPIKIFFRVEQDPVKKAALKKTYIEEQLHGYLTKLEALLKTNKGGDGYFVGDSLTWADLYLQRMRGSLDLQVDPAATSFDKYPKLAALLARVQSQPEIAAYLAKLPVTLF